MLNTNISPQLYDILNSTPNLDTNRDNLSNHHGADFRVPIYKTKYDGRDLYIQTIPNKLFVFFKEIKTEEDRIRMLQQDIFLTVEIKEGELEYHLNLPSKNRMDPLPSDFGQALDTMVGILITARYLS